MHGNREGGVHDHPAGLRDTRRWRSPDSSSWPCRGLASRPGSPGGHRAAGRASTFVHGGSAYTASSHWPPANRQLAFCPGSPVGLALDPHSAISSSAQGLAKKRRPPRMKMTPESKGVPQEEGGSLPVGVTSTTSSTGRRSGVGLAQMHGNREGGVHDHPAGQGDTRPPPDPSYSASSRSASSSCRLITRLAESGPMLTP